MVEQRQTASLPLETTIKIVEEKYGSGYGLILVGNSGLAVVIAPKEWHLHFIPECHDKATRNPLKYSLVFASSFLALTNWWFDKNQNPEVQRPNKVVSHTHNGMDRFWKRFFPTPKAYISKENPPRGRICDFYMGELVKDKEIMERLKKWAAHCHRFRYNMITFWSSN